MKLVRNSKEKIKKFSKQYLIGFAIGIVVWGTVSVIAATYFPSNQVMYENGTSGMQATDVQITGGYGSQSNPFTIE